MKQKLKESEHAVKSAQDENSNQYVQKPRSV